MTAVSKPAHWHSIVQVAAPAFQILTFQLMDVGEYPLAAFFCCGWAIHIVDVSPVSYYQPSQEHVAALSSGSVPANFERVAITCWAPAILSVGRRVLVPFVPDLDSVESLGPFG